MPDCPACRCVLCEPSVQDQLDQHKRRAIDDVDRYGWHAIKVGSPDDLLPGWCYTLGLRHSLGVPELVMAGLTPDDMHHWIHETVDVIRTGRRLVDGDMLDDVLEGYTLVVKKVAPGWAEALFGGARWFSGEDDPPFHQLVWPDPQRWMPWDDDATDNCKSQPRLWVPPDAHPAGPWKNWQAGSSP